VGLTLPTSGMARAGGADRRALAPEARAIFERVRLLIVPEADHVRLLAADPEAYQAAVLKLIGDCRCTMAAR